MRTLPAGERRRIFFEALVIVAFGAIVGLTCHHRLVIEAFSGAAPAAAPSAGAPAAAGDAPSPVPVGLREVEALLASGAVAVDARDADLFALGHLPDAVSLPLGAVDEQLPAFRQDFPLETPLIAYCSGFGCPDSYDLALRLLAAGYRTVMVFEGGLPAWRDAGLPVAAGAP